jgi:hypothetical protein
MAWTLVGAPADVLDGLPRDFFNAPSPNTNVYFPLPATDSCGFGPCQGALCGSLASGHHYARMSPDSPLADADDVAAYPSAAPHSATFDVRGNTALGGLAEVPGAAAQSAATVADHRARTVERPVAVQPLRRRQRI